MTRYQIPKGLVGVIDDVVTEICDKYYKYPNEWDSEAMGCELCESDICKGCPLNRLAQIGE